MNCLDVIFLSYTENAHFYGLTQRSILTLIHNNKNLDLNIILVETNPNIYESGFDYPDCNVIIPNEPFNYNKFINIGLKACKNKYVLICNNDLVFAGHSIENLLGMMQTHNFLSASPLEPNWHSTILNKEDLNADYIEGYLVQCHIAGWCICTQVELAKKMNIFDEKFKFWYQDNDYAMTLMKNNIKHYLIPSSIVYHEFSASHKLLKDKREEMTDGLLEVFKSKWQI